MATRPKTRRIPPKPETLPTENMLPAKPIGLRRPVGKTRREIICYCRVCQEVKPENDFYTALDPLDQNGRMSVCKACIQDLFKKEYALSGKDVYVSTMHVCRWLNMRYDSSIVDTAYNKTMERNNEVTDNFFGYYKQYFHVANPGTREFTGFVAVTPEDIYGEEAPKKKVTRDVRTFWGPNYSEADYIFLENEFEAWGLSHDISTKEQEVSFKIICQLQLDYEKARTKGAKDASKLITDIHKAMDVAGVSPGKVKKKEGQEANKTIGMLIKMMEETSPAEYYEDKKLFADYDDVDVQIRDFVTRPILNFLGKTPPDFYVEDDGEGGHGGDIISEDGDGFYEDTIEVDEDYDGFDE